RRRARDMRPDPGALDGPGRISGAGRAMAQLAVHPRLAHMLLRARELKQLPLGAQPAALLSERDPLRGGESRHADIRTRLEVLQGAATGGADRGTLERARRTARELERQLRGGLDTPHPHRAAGAPGLLLAFAYPDRIGRRRAGGEGRFTLANGRGA